MKVGGVSVADQQFLGLVLGVGAAAVWAVEAVLGKILLASTTFLQVAAVEAFFAALTVVAYLLARRVSVTFPRRHASKLVLVGLIGTVLAPVLYFFGLSQTFAINATLIAHLQPVFVALFGYYWLNERLQRRDLVAGLLIVGAAVLITSRTLENLATFTFGNVGDLTVLGATVSWAVVAIPGKQLTEDLSTPLIVGYRFTIASLVFLPVLFSVNQLAVTSPYQVLLGVLIGLGYVCYYEGLRRSKASHIALTELSAPFFTAILAWAFLGETLTPLQALGAALLCCGLFVLSHQRSRTQAVT